MQDVFLRGMCYDTFGWSETLYKRHCKHPPKYPGHCTYLGWKLRCVIYVTEMYFYEACVMIHAVGPKLYMRGIASVCYDSIPI